MYPHIQKNNISISRNWQNKNTHQRFEDNLRIVICKPFFILKKWNVKNGNNRTVKNKKRKRNPTPSFASCILYYIGKILWMEMILEM